MVNNKLLPYQKLSLSHYDDRQKRTLTIFICIFFLFAVIFAAIGYTSFSNFAYDYRHQAEHQISAIAELKMNELMDWRNERMGDAEVMYQNPSFSLLAERYFNNPKDIAAETQLRIWMGNYQAYNQYDQIHLLNAAGVKKLSIPVETENVDARLAIDVSNNLRSGKVTFLDFQRDTNEEGEIHISILVPIFADQSNSRLLGMLALRINPEKYLYPYLNQWPITSDSAETILVRREGDRVLFLNSPRFKPNGALAFSTPLTRTDLPAVKAVLGETEIIEGVDYRGKAVLADVRAIPDSPWFMVNKMDISEIYEPLRTRMWETFLITSMAIFITGTGMVVVWRQQRLVYYRAQAQAADELRESEENVRKLNAELELRVRERTNQLETINKELESFSYSVSHDLRAPLRGINGWSLALYEDYFDKLDEQGKQYLDRVRAETQHMESLIDNMLELSRVTRSDMQKEQVDLSATALSIIARLKAEEPKRQVNFEVQDNLKIKGDPNLLVSALTNLLGNAFKFTRNRAQGLIEFGQTIVNDERVFFVRDNGAGFNMDYSQKLFHAFQRLHKASEFPGTGVGLATVQRIIHRHGGRIWAEAEVDHGATFYFTLGEE